MLQNPASAIDPAKFLARPFSFGQLLDDRQLRDRMGASGRESVRRKFLLSRLLED